MALPRAGPATITALALALVLVISVTSRPLPATVIISIENVFPTHNLTVSCRSNIPAPQFPLILSPKQAYMFHSNPEHAHTWVCDFVVKSNPGNLCGDFYDGEFTVWQDERKQPATKEPLCQDKCLWFVDASGVSLIREQGGKPVHIYNWPKRNC